MRLSRYIPPRCRRPTNRFPTRVFRRWAGKWRSWLWERRVLEGRPPRLDREEATALFGDAWRRSSVVDARRLFFREPPSDAREATATLRLRKPDECEVVLQTAARVRQGRFSILSNQCSAFEERVEWHSDFHTGFTWPEGEFYKRVRHGKKSGDADIKVPWELSRFQWLQPLAEASWISGDASHARHGRELILDWIRRNPVGVGVNWACAMDVGIRAANWIAFLSIAPAEILDAEFLEPVALCLLEHGLFLDNNLEVWAGLTSNHFLGDVSGLFFIGLLFRDSKIGARWLNFAVEQLVLEIEAQIYPDGVDFEGSTSYHRLVLEMFSIVAILCRRNGIALPDRYWDRLLRMFRFVETAIGPHGRVPLVGDNDSGRFLYFLPDRPDDDLRYLLDLAALLYPDQAFSTGHEPDWEVAWFFGCSALDRFPSLPRAMSAESRRFENCGFHILRDGGQYALIPCGPNGQKGVGGHAHNDKLALALALNGEMLFADPGQFIYTPSPTWRNAFRSTRAHNTVLVNNEEQNPIREGALFSLEDCAQCRCLEWSVDETRIEFEGEHRGYERLSPGVRHRRRVVLERPLQRFAVTDTLLARESGTLDSVVVIFILCPGVEPEHGESLGETLLRTTRGRYRVRFDPGESGDADRRWALEFVDLWYAPAYGVKEAVRGFRWTARDVAVSPAQPFTWTFVVERLEPAIHSRNENSHE